MQWSFDLAALICPKTEEDVSLLLAEALAELQSIHRHFEALLSDPVHSSGQ
jgi:hypothetical protein